LAHHEQDHHRDQGHGYAVLLLLMSGHGLRHGAALAVTAVHRAYLQPPVSVTKYSISQPYQDESEMK